MSGELRSPGMWTTDIDCGMVCVVFCCCKGIPAVGWDDGIDMPRPVVLNEDGMSMSVLLNVKYDMPTPGVVDRRVECTILMLEEID